MSIDPEKRDCAGDVSVCRGCNSHPTPLLVNAELSLLISFWMCIEVKILISCFFLRDNTSIPKEYGAISMITKERPMACNYRRHL